MNVPNPLPLSEPWSPVGYQVVQVADECTAKSSPASASAEPPCAPRSPLGYQIVKVADEQAAPIALPERLRMPRLRRRLAAPPAKSSPNLAVFAAVGGACAVGFLIIASMVVSRSTAPHRQGQGLDGMGRVEAVIPAEFKDDIGGDVPPAAADLVPKALPVKQKAEGRVEPANVACAECAAGGAGGRESFGTNVQFVRNPQEAYRLAKAERKLTLVLHVAGNFEDSRFT
jgi:hypothetical protein